MFLYKGRKTTRFWLYDLVEDKEYGVEMDSFADGSMPIRNYEEDKTLVYTTLVRFEGRYYISGLMTELRGVGKVKIDEAVEEMRYQREQESQQKENYSAFLAAQVAILL